MTLVDAKCILKSKNTFTQDEVVTYQVYVPKWLQAQINKHRTFSICWESSRAKPTMQVIKQVLFNPFVFDEFGKNGKGMQPQVNLSGFSKWFNKQLWLKSRFFMCLMAYLSYKTGAHKETVNRYLEAWMMTSGTITATEWANFNNLRLDHKSQSVMQELAHKMQASYANISTQLLEPGEWHLPYIKGGYLDNWDSCKGYYFKDYEVCIHSGYNPSKPTAQQIATSIAVSGRCGRHSTPEKDMALFKFFREDRPAHLTPLEHACLAVRNPNDPLCANLSGFISYRKFIPKEQIGG